MIKVIGKQGCRSCVELKERLIKENIEFEYIKFEEMDRENKRKYVNKSRNAGIMHFPMVFKDDEVVADVGSLFN